MSGEAHDHLPPSPDRRPGPGALSEVGQLGTANALLSTLHDVVRSMATPLTAEELVPAIRPQLEAAFGPHASVLLTGGPDAGPMKVVHCDGVTLGATVDASELPPPLDRGPRARPLLLQRLEDGQGFARDAAAGAYLWLFARGRTVGLLAVEHDAPDSFPDGTDDVLERLALPLSLAVDNAVWFRRLQTLGAEQERQRLGAQLHDRFAQSLVAIAMGLDRTARAHPEDEGIGALRQEVRATLGDLRETLQELRATIDEDHSLVELLRDHLERVEERHGVITAVQVDPSLVRPTPGVAQQLLRVAQELTSLAVVDRRATSITVGLRDLMGQFVLDVADDGDSRTEPELGEQGRARLASVHERVDAIGGRVGTVHEEGRTVTTVVLRGPL